jgi:7-cyano-7-deazaguanine synthase in queuosine biosynthesis
MNLSISRDTKNIGVLFSGGMDSTLLLYLILDELNTREIDAIVKCYIMQPSPLMYARCTYILELFEAKFSRKIYKQKIQKMWLREAVKTILEFDGGIVFSGCNKVLDNLNPTVYIKGDTPPIRGNAYSELHYRPFIELDKAEIAYLYHEKNILDLIGLTYSCGSNFEAPCGGCYFCLERIWALSLINISTNP